MESYFSNNPEVFSFVHDKLRYSGGEFLQKQSPELFYKEGIHKNSAKFTRKHLCQSLFFERPETCNFIEKESLTQVFSCEFWEIFKNTYFEEHLRTAAPVP